MTAIAALLAITLIALMVGPLVIDWDAQRGRVVELLRERAGIEARIGGALSVSLLPTPELDAGDVEFGPAEQPFARAERLTISLSPIALLSGRITITGARADRAEIARDMMSRLGGVRSEGFGRLGQFGVERLTLRSVRLVDRIGAGSSARDRGPPHDVVIEAPNLLGPFRVDVVDPALGREFHAQIGRLEQGRARMKGLVEDRARALRASLDGVVALPGVPRRPLFEGQVTVNGNPVIGEGRAGQATQGVQVPLQGSFRLVADLERAIAEPLGLTFGAGERALQLAGRGEITFAGARPMLTLRASAKRLDLSPIAVDAPARARPTDFRAALAALAAGPGSVPPVDLVLDLDLGAVQVAGGALQDVALSIEAREGAPVLRGLALRLPGSTTARFTRASNASSAAIDGELAIESSELGLFAAWLRGREGAAGFPAEAKLAARLVGGLDRVEVNDIDLETSAGRMTGKGSLIPARPGERARPRLSLDLAATRFDAAVLAALEPLQPVEGLEVASRLAIDGLVIDGQDVGSLRVGLDRAGDVVTLSTFRLRGRSGEEVTLSGTASADGMSLTGKLDAERLGDIARLAGAIAPGAPMAAFARRAPLLEPALAVANIRIATSGGNRNWDVAIDGKLGGTAVRGRSRASHRAGDIEVEIDGEVTNPDSGRLLAQLAGHGLGGKADKPGSLLIRASGDPRRAVTGTLRGGLAGLELSVDGRFNPFQAQPFDGKFSASAEDLAALFAAFGPVSPRIEPGATGEAHGRLFVEGGKLTLTSLEARFGEAPASGEISFDFTRAGQVAGQIRLDTLDLAPLLEPATGKWRAGGRDWSDTPFASPLAPVLAGDLWIEARRGLLGEGTVLTMPQFVYRFAPDLVSIEGFEAQVNDARIAGALSAARKQARVEIAGRIEAARLPVPFLGGRLSGAIPFSGGGESLHGIITSLSGAGTVTLDRIAVSEADPEGLQRVTGRDLDELAPIEENRIGGLIEAELRKGKFEAHPAGWPASLSGGQVRISGQPLQGNGLAGIEIMPAITLDLVRREAEARLTFRQTALPKGWRGAVPEIGLSIHHRLAGSEARPRRALQVASLVNGLLAMAIQRDLERAEALEADIRERAMQLRRQKGDAWRLRREHEIVEVEAILAEDQRRIRARAEAAAEFERQRELKARLEREAREKAEREKAERERIEREKAEREARERAERERAQREKAERERAEREAAERAARERAEAERLREERLGEERARLEQLAREAAQPPVPAPAPAASGAPLNLAPPAPGVPPG